MGAMSIAKDKVRKRREAGQCGACGKNPCECKRPAREQHNDPVPTPDTNRKRRRVPVCLQTGSPLQIQASGLAKVPVQTSTPRFAGDEWPAVAHGGPWRRRSIVRVGRCGASDEIV
jgi:hypothetical protein